MNFKVKCIANNRSKYFVVGSEYAVKEGVLYDSTGSSYCPERFENVDEINAFMADSPDFGQRFELVEEETKYKVGDRVLIRSDLKVDKHYGGCRFAEWLAGLRGKVVKITRADAYPWGNIYDSDMGGFLSNEMIEKKVEEEKPFTKDDLKVGYVVEQRNGDLLMVMQTADGGVVTVNDAGFNWITEYDAKLKLDYLADGGADIVKIYGLSGCGGFAHKLSTEYRKLLWERKPEIHELTAEEAYKIIAEKKGVPVESLRVKWEG